MPVGSKLTEEQYEALRQEGWLPPAMRGELRADLLMILRRVRRMYARSGKGQEDKDKLHEIQNLINKWTF